MKEGGEEEEIQDDEIVDPYEKDEDVGSDNDTKGTFKAFHS